MVATGFACYVSDPDIKDCDYVDKLPNDALLVAVKETAQAPSPPPTAAVTPSLQTARRDDKDKSITRMIFGIFYNGDVESDSDCSECSGASAKASDYDNLSADSPNSFPRCST